MMTLNCKGRLLTIGKPIVMGILNATPDSFYTKGSANTIDDHLRKAEQMLTEGATILDIGGMSTRPNADEVSEAVELSRVIAVIEKIKEKFPESYISVDTYRSKVAATAVMAGADIVNDISAGDMDHAMLQTVAALNVPYIAMHMQGTPKDMQRNPNYEDVALEVLKYFVNKIAACEQAGIKDIIIDPGFGFGKTIQHNYQLLKQLHILTMLEKPLLAGISRKSMIYKVLGTDAAQALNGTSALHILALQQQAKILRVHDVKEAVECIALFEYYQQA